MFHSLPVFFIILIPVIMHTALERGVKSVLLYLRQLVSMSLLFAVFATQIWARSFLNTSTFGQARHINTGRSVEVARKNFYFLYGNYKEMSLGIGIAMIGGVLYSTVAPGATTALIFFWISIPPLIISPFLYNPHQFRFSDFMLDYYSTLKWFGLGAKHSDDPKAESWLSFHKRYRTQYSGMKIDKNKDAKGKAPEFKRRAWRSVIWMYEIVFPVLIAASGLLIYSVAASKLLSLYFNTRINIKIVVYYRRWCSLCVLHAGSIRGSDSFKWCNVDCYIHTYIYIWPNVPQLD
jgi:1,3-beta-glucan synthase